MREKHAVFTGLLMCVALMTSSCATPGSSYSYGFRDAHSELVLNAMGSAPTDGHPDVGGEFQGMVSYAKGDYASAMKDFLAGARYADKPSQLCIGLMYLNGNGVQKDPVMAYAWVAVAAERNYPSFVKTRDVIWQRLNGNQRKRALAQANTLLAQYGDAVAKPRMAMQLRQQWLQGTQSKTGYDDGSVQNGMVRSESTQYAWNDPGRCTVNSIDGYQIPGCNNGIGGRALKPDGYFRVRDREWNGSKGVVTVGPLQKVSTSKATASPASTNDQPNGP